MTGSTADFAKYTYVYWNSAYNKPKDENQDEIQDDHLQRLRRGIKCWNQWAKSFSTWLKNNNQKGFISFENIPIPKGVSFREIIFPCEVSFHGAKFEDFVEFDKATFNGDLKFTCVEFNHGVRFDNTVFNGCVDFNKAKFDGLPTGFVNAIFQKGGIFNQTEFNSDVTFENVIFNEDSHFKEARFNNGARFNNTIFNRCVDFTEAKFDSLDKDKADTIPTRFVNAEFKKGSKFSQTEFNSDVTFDNAIFNEDNNFEKAKFNNGVRFDNTVFNGCVDFTEAKFGGLPTGFRNAKFKKGSIFNQTEFNSATFFSRAIFNEYSAFNEAKFNQNANFSNTTFTSVRFNYAEFNKSADFSISKIDILVLENAEFKTRIPDFRYIRLETATYISNMQVPDLGNKKEKDEINNENVLLYRKLKELAIQSYDHQKELEFFGYETKAKRGVETSFISAIPGHLYGLFSRFGQSIFRPLLGLIAIWFASTLIIFNLAPNPQNQSDTVTTSKNFTYLKINDTNTKYCPDIKIEKPPLFDVAIYILDNSLPIFSIFDNNQNEFRQCLTHGNKPSSWFNIIIKLQQFFSFIFLFLLGLGLRNRFKIK